MLSTSSVHPRMCALCSYSCVYLLVLLQGLQGLQRKAFSQDVRLLACATTLLCYYSSLVGCHTTVPSRSWDRLLTQGLLRIPSNGTSRMLTCCQRGSTGGMSKYVLFLHSEAGHPLRLNPIGTIFASNWSWHYELHENVFGFMWVTLCANWQGFKLTMTTKTRNGWFCMGKQHVLAYIPNDLIVSLQFFCNDIYLLQGLHTTRNHVIWNGVWLLWRCCGEKWGLRHGQLDVCPGTGSFQALVFSAGYLYLWVLSLKTARSGA